MIFFMTFFFTLLFSSSSKTVGEWSRVCVCGEQEEKEEEDGGWILFFSVSLTWNGYIACKKSTWDLFTFLLHRPPTFWGDCCLTHTHTHTGLTHTWKREKPVCLFDGVECFLSTESRTFVLRHQLQTPISSLSLSSLSYQRKIFFPDYSLVHYDAPPPPQQQHTKTEHLLFNLRVRAAGTHRENWKKNNPAKGRMETSEMFGKTFVSSIWSEAHRRPDSRYWIAPMYDICYSKLWLFFRFFSTHGGRAVPCVNPELGDVRFAADSMFSSLSLSLSVRAHSVQTDVNKYGKGRLICVCGCACCYHYTSRQFSYL